MPPGSSGQFTQLTMIWKYIGCSARSVL
jgi:hypothetical protein